ncbi:response regulator transcription factor [Sutterella sp.]|uniref:response regulator transcription factor n=1 Tax=Sutterella sp. TaxID=1981025 RepID=UPI0026E0D32B|nr:response regulator [Sutterella sp.]MDO5531160.1 response regulator [Sutterella sp.]
MTDDMKAGALVRLVDDDDEQLKSLAFLLRMGGFEVMAYQSAASLLEMDDPRRPGCLVLDHRMPGMTGMELQAELVERGSLLPIIFLSAHGDIPMAMQAVHRGAMDFLVKPAEPDVLLAAVEKAVKKSFEDFAADAGQSDLAQKAATLTDREIEVARLVAAGLLNKQIADRLSISLGTVKLHRGNAAKKLGVRSAVAMAKALELAGLLEAGGAGQ